MPYSSSGVGPRPGSNSKNKRKKLVTCFSVGQQQTREEEEEEDGRWSGIKHIKMKKKKKKKQRLVVAPDDVAMGTPFYNIHLRDGEEEKRRRDAQVCVCVCVYSGCLVAREKEPQGKPHWEGGPISGVREQKEKKNDQAIAKRVVPLLLFTFLVVCGLWTWPVARPLGPCFFPPLCESFLVDSFWKEKSVTTFLVV